MMNLQCSEASPPTMSKTPQNMPKTSTFLTLLAAIFDNAEWLPYKRSNMAANVPYHLYLNVKFSKLSEFFDVQPLPPYTFHT